MPTKLAAALKTILAEHGLAGNVSGAAKKIGVASPGLKKILDGVAKPNKATLGKYQSYLGISDSDFANLMAGPLRKSTTKVEKKSAGRGRPTRKPVAETEEVPTNANHESYNDASEKDVTRAIFPTTQTGDYISHDSDIVEAALERALSILDTLIKDDLALRVHNAPDGIRVLIKRIIG